MDFSLLRDEPVEGADADLLGTGDAARGLAQLLIASRDETPLTVAVDAGRGMGKSSLMSLVRKELTTVPGVHTVWYNAWTSTGADALEGLIKSVLTRLDPHALRRAVHHVSEHRTLIRVIMAALLVVAAPFGAAGLVDRLWRDLSVDAKTRNEMRDALGELVKEWADSGEAGTRRFLVVFIDDLDRCSEEAVLAVCEAVKVYLDVPDLAFVVGCDRSALGPSGLLRELSPAGSVFMEKLFQTTYRIPRPGTEDVERYVRSCADRSGIGELLGDGLIRVIAERSHRNPRRIKRLINAFVLEWRLNPVWGAEAGFGPEAMIRTLLLQSLYADFYRILVRDELGGREQPHAIREFLDYRVARRVLSQPWVAPDPGDWARTVACLAAKGVGAPGPADADDWGHSLARLEQELPAGYEALARDANFVTLVEELMGLPSADALIERLQRGMPVAAPLPRASDDFDEDWSAESWNRPEGVGRYEGLNVLWVDDHPDNNTDFAARLKAYGARVYLAEERGRAEHVLGVTDIGLLLSDVGRGDEPLAGFTDLRAWRDSGRYRGPAVFFAGRVTPARRDQARELDAEIADGVADLFRCVDRVLAERERRQP
ncbi:P-loop NTPase fold protein [Streptomyces sp. MZ04]|uniref:P-loop NTPase fold protein n=1 Tax=Streptomyces sp. MZ04 TaxID=2559236 RepID=UPI00107EE8ED|nr:P-loop NTPase fold protein [Streptomyces sp. MZ04]TGB02531.1 response regulator [Streptomyces sp. MZ04]